MENSTMANLELLNKELFSERRLADNVVDNGRSSYRAAIQISRQVPILLADPSITTTQLLRALSIGRRAVIVICKGNLDQETMHCAMLALRAGTREAKNESESVLEETINEPLVRAIMSLLTHWKPYFAENIVHHFDSGLLERMLTVYREIGVHVDPDSRTEMVRLLALWWGLDHEDPSDENTILAGLMAVSRWHCDDDFVKPGLLTHLNIILKELRRCGHLDPVCQAAITQLHQLSLGSQVTFMRNLLRVAHQSSGTSVRRCYDKDDPTFFIKSLQSIFDLLKELLCLQPTMEVYQRPGLTTLVATTLVNTTVSVLRICPNIKSSHPEEYEDLIKAMDQILHVTTDTGHITWGVASMMQQFHGHHLLDLHQECRDHDCVLNHLPPATKDDTDDDIPGNYKDMLYGTVMSAPVMLHNSGSFVDDSTLVTILLESGLDPFTRDLLTPSFYSRDLTLQQEIQDWQSNRQ